MLSWSSSESGAPADLTAIARGEGDGGLPHGAALVAFAEAIARWDDGALATTRELLTAETDEAFMIDAAAVAANFEMMTRVADGTGARFDATSGPARAATGRRLGITGFLSAR